MSGKKILRNACGLFITLALLTLAVSTVQAQAPANDNFADATAITTLPFDDELYTNEASSELDEQIPDCFSNWPYPGELEYRTVWYAFTPTDNGLVQGYIDRDFDLGLAVYTGTDLANLTELGCWRYAWDYAFNVEANITYYIQIGGVNGGVGWMHLYFDFVSAPPNDNFVDALLIGLGKSVPSNNTAASLEANEPAPSCINSEYYGKTVWFVYTPASVSAVTAETGQYWTFIAAYTVNEGEILTEKGCRSDWYPLPLILEENTTYYFQVGSHND